MILLKTYFEAMLRIKVCGLTDPDNVKKIAESNPDIMGFIFYPGSKRYVGDRPEESLVNNVPSGILKTGVFVDEEPSKIIYKKNLFRLDLVQLHGIESPEYCDYLKNNGLTLIKAFGINNNFNFKILEKYVDTCEYFLFDTKTGSQGGSGLKFDWRRINEYNLDKQFLLSGGIGPEDASQVKEINHKYLFAVDINSHFEISPGIKNYKKIKEFIKEIKE
jgi:phosphoribosylanthranilate isomerase